ncbi:MAG: MarC family protein, partial [Caldilineaceae bacterium]
GESKPEEEIKLADKAGETAVFPLAVPSIASPGAMLAAVLMTENNRFSVWEQAETALIMLAVLVIVLVLLLASNGIQRLIGASGASIISRVMGMILASLAVASVLGGITTYFAL